MNLTEKKCLVTGAAGFIGSHLCERLVETGNEVIGVDCLTDYYKPAIKRQNIESFRDSDQFEFLEKNILDLDLPSLLPEIDAVFHQSAQAGVRASWGSEFDEYIDQNIRSTQFLLEGVKNEAPELPVVMASSSSVYGIPDKLPMKEEMKPQPYSPYGVTKLAAENLAMLYHANFDLKTVALRYFTVYGPRQRPDMAFTRFLGWISQNLTLTIFGDGTQSRDFTYVGDVAEANLAVIRDEAYGNVYNVGGGQRATLNEVIETMEDVVGETVEKEYEDVQEGDVPHTDADTSAIRSDTSWEPSVSLREGLSRQWEWLRDNELVLDYLVELQETPSQ